MCVSLKEKGRKREENFREVVSILNTFVSPREATLQSLLHGSCIPQVLHDKFAKWI